MKRWVYIVLLILGIVILSSIDFSGTEVIAIEERRVEKQILQKKDIVAPQKTQKSMVPIPIAKKSIQPVQKSKKREEPKASVDTSQKDERPNDMVYDTSQQGITDAMRAFMPNIRDCYQNLLKEFPDSEGRITLSFRIVPNDDPENMDIAKITDVEIVESDMDYARVENCIMDTIDTLWFDPPEDAVYVQYPFLFSY